MDDGDTERKGGGGGVEMKRRRGMKMGKEEGGIGG